MNTTVLVIEDDLEINELIGEYLTLEGIRYLHAESGKAGIHLAAKEHPDAVILDLMLPDIDGFEVARAISTHRATFDIPIVVLSCMCQDCDKEKGFGSGARFFLTKPFLPDDLLATVRQAIDWKMKLKGDSAGMEADKGGSNETLAAAGSVKLGANGDPSTLCSKLLNQVTADLFARTDLSDSAVADIREALETLNTWAVQWNAEHPERSTTKIDYRIGPRDNGATSPPGVEWKLTEETPGLLADAFFKTAPSGTPTGGGLIGWGASTLVTKPLLPIAPSAKWLQVLAKTGAARFEKDSKSRTVRFFTPLRTSNGSPTPPAGPVPVVEIDGMRYPTRLRDEALAAKRK